MRSELEWYEFAYSRAERGTLVLTPVEFDELDRFARSLPGVNLYEWERRPNLLGFDVVVVQPPKPTLYDWATDVEGP